MTVLVVPFHQDDRLADACIPLPAGERDAGGGPVDVGPAVVDPVLPDGDQWSRLVALHGAVADAVADALANGRRYTGLRSTAESLSRKGFGIGARSTPVVVLSGDCLVALGTLTGAQRTGIDPAIVWVDAHGDVHTLASSTSGYLGGMVLRMAVGGDQDRLTGPLGLRPVAEERVVLVDARDLDPGEVAYLATSRITRTTVEAAAADVVRTLPEGPLVVHLDLDVVDSDELTGLLFPAPRGPRASTVLDAVRRLLATGRVAVLDVACPWHPAADDAEAATRAALLGEVLALLPRSPG